ncbi:MAG: hypothetical protein WD336_08825 [Trueperaceae bacterium]
MVQPASDPPHAVMYAYPWDLYAPGAPAAVERLVACGVDAVQLAVSYHVASFLTPRDPSARVRPGDLGSLLFDPDRRTELHDLGPGGPDPDRVDPEPWPLDPPVAPAVRSAPPHAALVDAAHARGLHAYAWVVFLYNHVLAGARPDLAVRNAYGDRHPAQLCPANPTVRAYARRLADATARLAPFDLVVCESLCFLPYDYGLLNHKAAVRPHERARLLLGLCFCEHCRSAAEHDGVNMDALAAAVRADLDAHLAALPDRAGPERSDLTWSDPDADAAFATFLRARERSATSLQLEVLGRLRSADVRVGSSSVEMPDPRVTGLDVGQVRPLLHELRIDVAPSATAEAIARSASWARQHAPDDLPLYAMLMLDAFDSERTFAETLARARRAGVHRFRFYAYGQMTERQLAWLETHRNSWRPGSEAP